VSLIGRIHDHAVENRALLLGLPGAAIGVPAETVATADSAAGSGSAQRDGKDGDEGALTVNLPREMVIYR
jgi:hypothetical protein